MGIYCAIYYKELLECIQSIFQKNQTSSDSKQMLIACSKKVANSVAGILEIAEILKGNDYADPEDPSFVAENELLGAANAIESAAKKLSSLQPRQKTQVSVHN